MAKMFPELCSSSVITRYHGGEPILSKKNIVTTILGIPVISSTANAPIVNWVPPSARIKTRYPERIANTPPNLPRAGNV